MKIREVNVNRFIAKSKVFGVDFVINPYVGCPNACLYCYASFLRNLKGYKEEWGTFLDVKKTNYKLKKMSVEGKSYLMSSSTDCYNLYEEKYEITRNILKQLVNFKFSLRIETKNSLILRDIDLLKKMYDVKVIISLNTLNQEFSRGIESCSPIKSRLETIKKLAENKIKVIVAISPIFPFLTDYKEIILKTLDEATEYIFEFLNLKSTPVKKKVLKYINEKYPEYYLEYAKIYLFNDNTYFMNLKKEISLFCDKLHIKYTFK